MCRDMGWEPEDRKPRRAAGTRGVGAFRPGRGGRGRRRRALCVCLPELHRVSGGACGCERSWTRCRVGEHQASGADATASYCAGTNWFDAGSQSGGSAGTRQRALCHHGCRRLPWSKRPAGPDECRSSPRFGKGRNGMNGLGWNDSRQRSERPRRALHLGFYRTSRTTG